MQKKSKNSRNKHLTEQFVKQIEYQSVIKEKLEKEDMIFNQSTTMNKVFMKLYEDGWKKGEKPYTLVSIQK